MKLGFGAPPSAALGAPYQAMGAPPSAALGAPYQAMGVAPQLAPGCDPQQRALVAKMVAKVASNPCTSLAIIAVLTILVVGMYVYYHGFLFLGPYAARATKRAAGGAEKAADKSSAADKDSAKGDPETERLIESINSA